MTESNKKSAWEQYKEKLGDARPWHLFDKANHVSEDISSKRFDICKSCPEFIDLTNQCKQCGCLMNLKTKLEKAECPLGKW